MSSLREVAECGWRLRHNGPRHGGGRIMQRRVGFLSLLRIGEFRAVWAAECGSVVGDQLVRVAVSVLVFARTGSAAAATVTYALTMVPSVLGGVLLSWTADRYRRRTIMVAADAVRAVLVALMAVPGLPVAVVAALVVAIVLLRAPHTAAQGALLPQILGERYELGLALRQITNQLAQVGGFGLGGIVVALVAPTGTLLIAAVLFAVSALLVRFGTAPRERPLATGDGGEPVSARAQVINGMRALMRDRARRALVVMALVVGCYIVPEALAVPYTAQIGAGATEAGLLMAAGPLGSMLGAWAFVRFMPLASRDRLVGVIAVLTGVPLLPTIAVPSFPAAFVLWTVSGALAGAYVLQSQASFVRRTPDAERGQALGLAGSAMIATQGLAVVGGGALADGTSPATAIAAAAGFGLLVSAATAVSWARARGRHTAPNSPDAEGPYSAPPPSTGPHPPG